MPWQLEDFRRVRAFYSGQWVLCLPMSKIGGRNVGHLDAGLPEVDRRQCSCKGIPCCPAEEESNEGTSYTVSFGKSESFMHVIAAHRVIVEQATSSLRVIVEQAISSLRVRQSWCKLWFGTCLESLSSFTPEWSWREKVTCVIQYSNTLYNSWAFCSIAELVSWIPGETYLKRVMYSSFPRVARSPDKLLEEMSISCTRDYKLINFKSALCYLKWETLIDSMRGVSPSA